MVVVFVKEGLRFQHHQDLSLSFKDNENELQSCWIETINELGPNTITSCYYKHPKKPSNKFQQQLKIILTKISNRNKYIIVCLDFN